MEGKDLIQKLGTKIQSGAKYSMVDLHGLSVDQSRSAVNHHLSVAEQASISSFRFVTGRGNHINNKGERGTLYREFPNWLSEDNLNKVASIKKYDGYYEINMLQTTKENTIESAFQHFTEQFLISDIDKIKKQAEAGIAEDQFLLGHCYQYGLGLQQDYKQAANWYEKSAAANHVYAVYALGGCYWQGNGVRQNDRKAIELFEKAAAQSFVWAFNQLGDIYHYGHGVRKDFTRSKDYYEKASKLGLDVAKRKLAHAYFFGYGVEKDQKQGFTLFKEVADRGDVEAAYNVACAYLHGYGIKENANLAFQYAKQAADADDPDAQYFISKLYYQGIGTKENSKRGFEYLQRSADNNFKHALFQLALMTMHDDPNQFFDYLIKAAKAEQIVAQAMMFELRFLLESLSEHEQQNIITSFWQQTDDEVLSILNEHLKFVVIDAYIDSDNLSNKQKEKILRLLAILAKQQSEQALLRLGEWHYRRATEKDSKQKAEHYWLLGAKLGEHNCLCSLGYLSKEKGEYKKAFAYHIQAAALGNANSCNELGLLYGNGQGVEKSVEKAIEYYHKAVELDSSEMRSKLKQHIGGLRLRYGRVYPHAACNLGRIYAQGNEKLPSDKKKAIEWFTRAAEAGDEAAKEILTLLNLPIINSTNQQVKNVTFWKSPEDKKVIQQPILTPHDALKEITTLLNIKSTWKISKDNDAWCYIDAKELIKLEPASLSPFVLRKAKDGQHILLLERISTYDLHALVNQFKTPLNQQMASLKFN